jgi:hypothetical protein
MARNNSLDKLWRDSVVEIGDTQMTIYEIGNYNDYNSAFIRLKK